MATAAQIIAKAKTYLGMNGTTFRTAYYGSDNAEPWCVTFVWYVFKQLGASNLFCGGALTAYVGYVCNYYQNAGRFFTSNPQVGDLVLFNWQDGGDIYDHIGIVTSVEASVIHTIEGNTDNGVVALKTRSRNNTIIGYCRPAYSASSDGSLSYGDSGTAVKTMQQMLMMTGFSCGDSGADGNFGDNTLAALKSFQSKNGLSADGVYGSSTKAKLTAVYNALGVFTATAKNSVAVRTGPSVDNANLAAYPNVAKNESVLVAKTVTTSATVNKWYYALVGGRYMGYTSAKNYNTDLALGSSGTAVKTMQQMLLMTGHSCGSSGADGNFGSDTQTALKSFQSKNGLTANGIYNAATKTKLTAAYNALGVFTATAKNSVAVRTGPSVDNPNLAAYSKVAKGEKIRVAKTVTTSAEVSKWYFALVGERYMGYTSAKNYTKS
ncbi:MAG: peptidoglycan-binding protein [Eubacteriales bacterium]|nr:peptidoglycan-binding protein [Eubacteriales bacterium]